LKEVKNSNKIIIKNLYSFYNSKITTTNLNILINSKNMEQNQQEIAGKQIGIVSSYFSHVGVAAIKLSDNLKVKDKIKIKGQTTDLETDVGEIQIEREPVQNAKAGDHIGIKVPDKVRPNDKVFLI
jgi:hypothetical protein